MAEMAAVVKFAGYPQLLLVLNSLKSGRCYTIMICSQIDLITGVNDCCVLLQLYCDWKELFTAGLLYTVQVSF